MSLKRNTNITWMIKLAMAMHARILSYRPLIIWDRSLGGKLYSESSLIILFYILTVARGVLFGQRYALGCSWWLRQGAEVSNRRGSWSSWRQLEGPWCRFEGWGMTSFLTNIANGAQRELSWPWVFPQHTLVKTRFCKIFFRTQIFGYKFEKIRASK